MLKVQSPKNLKDEKSCNEATSSQTAIKDEEICAENASSIQGSPSFVLTNNDDYCLTNNLSDVPSVSKSTSNSLSETTPGFCSPTKDDFDQFKVPFPVKSSPHRKSLGTDRKSSPTNFTAQINQSHAWAVIDELFKPYPNLNTDMVAHNTLDSKIKEETLEDTKGEIDMNCGLDSSSSSPRLRVKKLEMEEEEDEEQEEEDEEEKEDEDSKPQRKVKKRKRAEHRKKRSLKEDVPLSERIRNRYYTNLKKNKAESPIDKSQFRSEDVPWTEEEKMDLLKGLKRHGHFDMKQLQKFVPSRSQKQVHHFVRYQLSLDSSRKFYQKSKPKVRFVMGRINPHSRDVAVEIVPNINSKNSNRLPGNTKSRNSRSNKHRNGMSSEDPSNEGCTPSTEAHSFWSTFLSEMEHCLLPDYLTERRELFMSVHRHQALGHAFYLIKEFERHPPPCDTGGVDIKACYNFLWCCLVRQSLPPMNHATRLFLSQQFDNMQSSVSQNDDLMNYMKKLKRDVDEQCVGAKRKKNSTTSSRSIEVPHSDENDHAEKEEKQFFGLEMMADEPDSIVTEADEETQSSHLEEGGTEVLARKRGRHWQRRITSDSRRIVFKHAVDVPIPHPDPAVLSTLTPILKNVVYNPLSIPLSVLKR